MHGGTSLAAAGGGTTRGGATTAASLTLMSNEAEFTPCVKSVGTFDSQKDYCYTCGSREKGTLGYCWNSQGGSQHPQCIPACDNWNGVSGIGDNQCGEPCDGFVNERNISPLYRNKYE